MRLPDSSISDEWGEVLRVREDRHGQPSPVIVLYGDLLDRVLKPTEAALAL